MSTYTIPFGWDSVETYCPDDPTQAPAAVVADGSRDCWREVYGTYGRDYGRIPASWDSVEISIRVGRKIRIYTDTKTNEVVLLRAYTGREAWNTCDCWLKDGKLQHARRGPMKIYQAMNSLADNINANGLAAALQVYRDKYVMCCCCGAELTDPVSRQRGIGPVCHKKIGVAKLMSYLFGG